MNMSAASSRMLLAVGLGGVTGLRSAMPLALLSARMSRAPGQWEGPVGILARPWVCRALVLASAGELLADKLPFIPARTSPLPLAGRLLAGALVAVAAGAAMQPVATKLARRRRLITAGGSAVAGAAAALATSHAGQRFRAAGARRRLPDLPLALFEDLVGLLATRRLLSLLR